MSGPASTASPTRPTVCTWQISLAPASFMAGAKERGSPKDSITAAGWRARDWPSRCGFWAKLHVMKPQSVRALPARPRAAPHASRRAALALDRR